MTQTESTSQSTTSPPQKQIIPPSPVVLDYEHLLADRDLTTLIAQAFGSTGLGVLIVKNVPNLLPLRKRLLLLASEFAALPEDVKESCTHAESKYSFGWYYLLRFDYSLGRMGRRL
jgi:hypothetical protein